MRRLWCWLRGHPQPTIWLDMLQITADREEVQDTRQYDFEARFLVTCECGARTHPVMMGTSEGGWLDTMSRDVLTL